VQLELFLAFEGNLCSVVLLCAKLNSMSRVRTWQHDFRSVCVVLRELLQDGWQFITIVGRSRTAVAAEVLFLRKQLAYYQDHKIRPRRLTDAARVSLVLWSLLFDWKEALAIVTPGTFVRWHRKAFKLFWRWKSKGGRPPLPKDIRQLIARMVKENMTWGEERIADELSLKLVSTFRRERSGSIGHGSRMRPGADELRRNTGVRSSRITPKGSSLATSWLR
jgi:hypothetical protein